MEDTTVRFNKEVKELIFRTTNIITFKEREIILSKHQLNILYDLLLSWERISIVDLVAALSIYKEFYTLRVEEVRRIIDVGLQYQILRPISSGYRLREEYRDNVQELLNNNY